MDWDIETTDEFDKWWEALGDDVTGSIDAYVRLLEDQGPQLPFPYSSGIEGSKHGRMRELRVQSNGDLSDLLCLRSKTDCDFAHRWKQRRQRPVL
jgi:hypothetical protein